MKIALVTDWITTVSGSEELVQALHRIWPDAPLYTAYADKERARNAFPNADVRASFIGRIPSFLRVRPLLALLLPLAMESFDFTGYDVVISVSGLVSKGIIVPSATRHISYCMSPPRQLWDLAHAQRGMRLGRHLMRLWDSAAAKRISEWVAISHTAAKRIETYYRQTPRAVIYPPVQVQNASAEPPHPKPYYLFVGRLYAYKNVALLLELFSRLQRDLVIIGTGPLEGVLQRHASPNVHMRGYVDDATLSAYMVHAKALIVPNEEDFGLTIAEAHAHGTPVLALRTGGAMEIIEEGVTGEFFNDAIPEAIGECLMRFEQKTYDAETIRARGASFSEARFQEAWRAYLS
ncbi:MAG: glycosyltransferase [Patescibacteria group bacterium]